MESLKEYSVLYSTKKKKTAAVVGGASFIGSHLCDALLVQGFRVICIDTVVTATEKNITSLKKNPDFTYIKLSIEAINWNEIPHDVSYWFYLAGIENSLKNDATLSSLLLNSSILEGFLSKALKTKASFLYLSLADIYSGIASRLSLDNYFGRTKEEESLSAIIEAKRFGEALVEEFRRDKGLKATVVRIRDVYGPKMSLDSPFPLNQLYLSFFNSKKITILGDGLDELYPTYISDVVYGLIKAMFSVDSEGKVYYLVNPQKITIAVAAEKMAGYYKEGGAITFVKSDVISLPQPIVDISLSRRDLRWESNISWDEGLEKTILWFKKDSQIKKKEAVKAIEVDHSFQKKDYVYEPTTILKKKPTEETIDDSLLTTSSVTDVKEVEHPDVVISPLVKTSTIKEELVINKDSTTATVGRKFSKLKLGFLVLCIVFIIFGLLSPLFFSTFFALKGLNSLKEAKNDVAVLNLASAGKDAASARNSFKTASNSLNNLLWLFSLIHKRQQFQTYVYALDSGKAVSEALVSLTDSGKELQNSLELFIGKSNQGSTIQSLLPQLKSSLLTADDRLSEAQSKMGAMSIDYFPAQYQSKIVDLKNQLADARKLLQQIDQMTVVLPQVLGTDGDKVYLIVFQNNHEKRATGGFIGSYARVLVSQGKVKEIKVDDIYNPDGQIASSPTAPEALKKYLSVQTWGMRDANWSPDFSVSATDIMNLYSIAAHEEAEGVVGIDLYTVQNILRALGSVQPEGYNETITADNFFEKAEYYAEVGFKPGSTSKKDFLGACGEAVLNKILALNQDSFVSLGKALVTSINEKHILMAFKDEVLTEVINGLGWSGKIATDSGDFLWIIDSNVGGNKSNFFVDRSSAYTVLMDKDGKLSADLSISYKHKGQSNAWPGGNYRNYLRVLVPTGAFLLGSEGFSSEVKTSSYLGKTMFEGLVEVKTDTVQDVSLMYSLPSLLNKNDDNWNYRLISQKQLGDEGDMFSFNFEWPRYLTLLSETPETMTIKDQKASLKTTLNVDKVFQLNFINTQKK